MQIFKSTNKYHLSLMAFFLLLTFQSQRLWSAIPRFHPPTPAKNFITEGTFRGGSSGDGYSLRAVKRVYAKDGNSERYILQIGDKDGRIFSGPVGYFHGQLTRQQPRFSLDLAQLAPGRVTEGDWRRLVAQSKIVKAVDMSTDPEDQSTNITMNFRKPVQMRVYTVASKLTSPKLIIDITRTQ